MVHLSSDKINEFADSLAAEGASELTMKSYKADLEGLFRRRCGGGSSILSTDNKVFDHICATDLTTQARLGLAPSTIRRRMAAFRRYAIWEAGASILARYRAPVSAKPEPHPLPEGIPGVVSMIDHANTIHHKALVALCGLCGLRAGEALQVTPRDLDGNISVLVRGKGKKQRRVPLSTAAWLALEPALVVAINLKQPLCGGITDRPARAAIERIGERALGRKVASHDLRATFATAAFNKCKNLRVVQELLGHADSHTTEVYTGVTKAAMADAVDLT